MSACSTRIPIPATARPLLRLAVAASPSASNSSAVLAGRSSAQASIPRGPTRFPPFRPIPSIQVRVNVNTSGASMVTGARGAGRNVMGWSRRGVGGYSSPVPAMPISPRFPVTALPRSSLLLLLASSLLLATAGAASSAARGRRRRRRKWPCKKTAIAIRPTSPHAFTTFASGAVNMRAIGDGVVPRQVT